MSKLKYRIPLVWSGRYCVLVRPRNAVARTDSFVSFVMAGLFNAAIKSFSTPSLSSQYTLSPQPTSFSGPWKIYDGKKKSTGQPCSVFVFERSSLAAPGNSLSLRSSNVKAAHDEVVDRLKKEVALLARLRHPNILEVVEPLEESRSGLMFVTEVVVGSLQSVLDDKAGGSGNASSRGGSRHRDLDIDELEIQKGLLQLAKGLEFLHESAGLVHGNLTPESVFVNSKSDWKIAGLAFAASHRDQSTPSSASQSPSPSPVDLVSLAGQHDQRLPSSVQLNLDYCSPDLLLDSSVTPAHDLFSLGLFIIAIYNSPHESPLKSQNSPTNFRRLFSSSVSIPNQSNNFLCSKPIPTDLVNNVLPRLITRRPANRLSAKEFQEASYFDNILVSTIRFLDSFPAKSASEKNAFMRGLPKVLPQFPNSVAQKKILPMLVEELKDKGELLPWTLAAVLTLVGGLPTGSRLIGEKILPAFRATFDINKKKDPATGENVSSSAPRPGTERDGRDAALAVMLEHLATLREKCTTNEFRDDVVPLYLLALDSPTSHLQGLALKSLGQVLPNITYNSVKTEIFPVVSTVFVKTSSLGIKIACFESLRVLCGGSITADDGLSGEIKGNDGTSVCLDKFTIQEKVVPLIKGIKTREPAVMMAALELYTQIGSQADTTTLATEIIPALWALAIGPLLNMQQFKAFMATIRRLSSHVEQDQLKKLADTATVGDTSTGIEFGAGPADIAPMGVTKAGVEVEDFEELVFGKKSNGGPLSPDPFGAPIAVAAPPSVPKKDNASFAWSTPSPTLASASVARSQAAAGRNSVTPDPILSGFGALQPNRPMSSGSMQPSLQSSRPGIPSSSSSNAVMGGLGLGMGNMSIGAQNGGSMSSMQSASRAAPQPQPQSPSGGIDWSSALKKPTVGSTFSNINSNRTPSISTTNTTTGGWGVMQQKQESHPTILFGQTRQQAPPPQQTEFSGWSIAPPPSAPAAKQPVQNTFSASFGTNFGQQQPQPQQQQQQKPQGMGMGMNANMGMGMGMGMSMQPMQPSKNPGKSGLDAFENGLGGRTHDTQPPTSTTPGFYNTPPAAVTMSLPPPALVVSLTQSIRARPILWDQYQRTNVINEQELRLIKAVDKVPKDKRVAAVEGDSQAYASLLVGGPKTKGLLERSAKRVEFVQYLLALGVELCEDVPSYITTLNSQPDPYSHLITLLDHGDDPIPVVTSSLLTTLISASLAGTRVSRPTEQALPTLFKYLATISASSESNLQDLAVQSYVLLLRNSHSRLTFWDMGDETVKGLTAVVETAAAGSKGKGTTDVGLSTSGSAVSVLSVGAASTNLKQGGVNLQLLYHVLVAIWELSFEEPIAEELDEKYDLILPLVHLLRSAIKEKILRVCLAIFANLIEKAPATNLPSLLLARLLPLLTTLKSRKFTDPDLTADLDSSLEALEAFQVTQTNFDEYATEIRSGHLSWTPPHRSQDFWKKNARRIMEENGGELVACLARALRESEDKLVLAVAAHDVGVLVKELPEKRRVWDTAMVKARVMELMGHSDPEVRYESLKAVQEFLRHAFGG
ncbi:hypothetical protein Dda_5199 [Drechslerella dactyloides]|uniref:Protein kinase domain-containing protein n=1 Tax=Drechslerella dactyloides TaxID=74499 RepID=A0AAD6IWC5_DREDA|nr:hypothetical protein Dda_5199 [Drechslerella dactyloides]